MELSEKEKLARLRLIRSENIGPVSFRQLLARYGTAERALGVVPELARRGGRSAAIKICSTEAAAAEIAALRDAGGELIHLGEDLFPRALTILDDAPPLLATRGHRHLLKRPAVAVVGARNASANGRRLAQSLAEGLSGAGYLVVSGLARGIDAAAHRGALAGGTAAVIAGGLDISYPPENTELQEAIASQGLLLTEMRLGTVPQARHFPRRNRIISGLSLGVVVVEAALKSGSLITARLAAEQGREVFALPGSPLDPRARGCNKLIQDGATLVEDASDILQALERMTPAPVSEPERSEFMVHPMDESNHKLVESARRELLGLLSPTPVQVDELLRQCQFSPAVVSLVILELELAGRLERHPGNRVAIVAEAMAEGLS